MSMLLVQDWTQSRSEVEKRKANEISELSRRYWKSEFPPITGPNRRLAITAKATKLARLDESIRKLDTYAYPFQQHLTLPEGANKS